MKLTVLSLLLLAPASLADTIYLIDGTAIEDCTVRDETLKGVTYKLEGKSGDKVASLDEVLRVTYKRLPKEIDEAEEVYRGGEIVSASDILENYLTDVLSGEKRERISWAPAHAMHRLIEIYLSAGNPKGVISTANKLFEKAPQSRHVTTAYLAKAEAQAQLGNHEKALATLAEFKNKIDEAGLSQRWSLEQELSSVLIDPAVRGDRKRERLIDLASRAEGSYPTVRSRARVAEGESYLETDDKDFSSAREVFEAITANINADPATLAGAHTGLGDCLFQEAVDVNEAGGDAGELLEGALDNYLRVAVLFAEQERYAAKSSYFAGKVFEFMQMDDSRDKARTMYINTVRRYEGTEWSDKAVTELGG